MSVGVQPPPLAPSRIPRPGIVVSLEKQAGLLPAVQEAAGKLRVIGQDHGDELVIQLHAHLTDTRADAALDALRAILPDVRVWLGLAGNPFAAWSTTQAVQVAGTWATWGRMRGLELGVLNLERDDPGKDPKTMRRIPPRPGHGFDLREWSKDVDITDAQRLDFLDRTQKVIEAVDESLPVGMTSHDCPQYFPLPWGVLLGMLSRVLLHFPQHYPGHAGGATAAEMKGRVLQLSAPNWKHLADTGVIRPEFVPMGSAWGPYIQLYHTRPEASNWAGDQANHLLGWTLGEADADGVHAIRCALRARREAGNYRGALARWQLAHGLQGDSLDGAKTDAAMGL